METGQGNLLYDWTFSPATLGRPVLPAVLGGFVNSAATVSELYGVLHLSDAALAIPAVEVLLLTKNLVQLRQGTAITVP